MTRIRCEECGAVFESQTDMILCPICQNFEDQRDLDYDEYLDRKNKSEED
jgi:uncharacterized Zn finger protein (UPF0148 family)